MTFKARRSRYLLELAPTGRARCRRCGESIAKGAARWREVAFVCPGRTTALFRHATPHCVTRAFADAVLDAALASRPGAVDSGQHGAPTEAESERSFPFPCADRVGAAVASAAHDALRRASAAEANARRPDGGPVTGVGADQPSTAQRPRGPAPRAQKPVSGRNGHLTASDRNR